jgi:hypothetical protein
LERRAPAQFPNLRSRLIAALVVEPPAKVSAAQERILERSFFEVPGTPKPASVISLPPRLPRP